MNGTSNKIQGLLPGWWLGENDGRPHEPYVSPSRWDEELRGAGFCGADAIVYDEPAPFQTNAHIVARPTPKPIKSHRVTLLTDSNWDSLKSEVETLFAKKGFEIDHCSLAQTPPPNQDVISLLELHDPYFDNLSKDNFGSILAFINRLENSGVLWLTKSAQINSRDPRYAQTIGMTRTIRNELAIDLATLEIDCLNDLAWESEFASHSGRTYQLQLHKNQLIIVNMVLEKCMHCGKGFIKPIKPLKLFEAAHIEGVIRLMQKGQHIGKIVVSMPQDQKELPTSLTLKQLTLRPDVSYLLVGGLGGLGKSISTWMVENGARHIIYLGRSTGMSEDDKNFFKELQSLGCTLETVIGSVSKLEDVQKAVHRRTIPVVGVIQMSMVLRVRLIVRTRMTKMNADEISKDRPLKEMTHDDWEAAIQPKVQGTWNLHHVLEDLPRDFFVLFSSFSGIVGHWGQANCAVANTFPDAFT